MNRGFTIIELVVVIAIIAILAGVVLINITQYINKGKDTAIKAQVDQIRTAAADYFAANNDSYTGMCPGDGTTGCDQAESNITNLAGSGAYRHLKISSNSYCLSFNLSNGTAWCIDSTGYAGSNDICNVAPAHGYACQ